jgi:predicted O-methyltransferase YrrM
MLMPTSIETYIQSFSPAAHPVLEKILQEERLRNDIRPSIGPTTGHFLYTLVQATNAKKILEFGTCLGYSAIYMGLALKNTGGHLTTIELDENLCIEAQHYIEEAGLEKIIEVICGDAALITKSLTGPYDMILQDSDKSLYTSLLPECLRLVKKQGVILADDTLFLPMGIPEQFSQPTHQYNQTVFSNPDLVSTILPIGDGLTLSVKQKN